MADLRHVKTTSIDDGGCMVCDECDLLPDHLGKCDCGCDIRTTYIYVDNRGRRCFVISAENPEIVMFEIESRHNFACWWSLDMRFDENRGWIV